MTNVAGSIGAAIITVAGITSPAAAQKTVTEAGPTVSVTAAIREIDAAKHYVVAIASTSPIPKRCSRQ